MDQILAKTVLALLVIILMAYLFRRETSQIKAYKKILLVLFSVVIVLAIFSPDLITQVANFLGIGRGADLIIYITAITVVFKIANDSLRRQVERKKTAKIVRKIALLERKLQEKELR